MRYVSVRPSQEPLRSRIREIAAVRVSYGYRRVHVLLRREGWPINRKRVHRLYREEGLCPRAKRPKRRRMAVARQVRPAATEPNPRWAMDFMSDALHNGYHRPCKVPHLWSLKSPHPSRPEEGLHGRERST
jgi:putative transposase